MATSKDLDLDEIHHFALDLTKRAGQLLDIAWRTRCRSGNAHTTSAMEKESSVDLVTETDEDIEQFVRSEILEKYPTHKFPRVASQSQLVDNEACNSFIGEESYAKGATKDYLITDEPTWVVDPLDGTVNYIHLFPMFCISLAFVVAGEPVIGIIHAPFLNQTFSACRGRGAWLNETQRLPLLRNPIPPMRVDAPKGCIFSCEWGKDRRDSPQSNLHRKVEGFVNMASEIGGRQGKGGMVHGMRSLGSAALDLAYCALGAFDIWHEGGCWEWDVAAGVCLLKEAGGLVTTANPPDDISTAPIDDAKLGGRLYLAIRPAGDSAQESGRQGQERTVREVWRRVQRLDYTRPGV